MSSITRANLLFGLGGLLKHPSRLPISSTSHYKQYTVSWIGFENINSTWLQKKKIHTTTQSKSNKANYTPTVESSKNENRWNEMLEELTQYIQKHQTCRVSQEYPVLGNWVKNQRTQFKKNSLSKHRIEALSKLDFEFDDQNALKWENMLQQLIEYKRQHGDADVPYHYSSNPTLGRWVNTQRREYNRLMNHQTSKITQERIRSLEEVGFIFDALEHTWQTMYIALKDYKQQNGNSNVPKKYPENPPLGTWVSTQRTYYKQWMEDSSSIYFPKHRRDALNKIQFVWDYFDSQWDEQYLEMQKFHNNHGHCLVPFVYESDPALGIWVQTQRKQYALWKKYGSAATKLTPERKQKLDALEFVWDVRAAQWQERFDELNDFVQMNGHSYVPSKVKPLGSWVSSQRYQYQLWKYGKPSRLTDERREKLNSIGFEWESRSKTNTS